MLTNLQICESEVEKFERARIIPTSDVRIIIRQCSTMRSSLKELGILLATAEFLPVTPGVINVFLFFL